MESILRASTTLIFDFMDDLNLNFVTQLKKS